jgi:hypothetical protein
MAFGFGNHDGQYTHDKPTLANLLDSYPTALFSRGEDWVAGHSNYPIVLPRMDSLAGGHLLDSHDSRIYEGGSLLPITSTFPNSLVSVGGRRAGEVPLYAFIHIPFPNSN